MNVSFDSLDGVVRFTQTDGQWSAAILTPDGVQVIEKPADVRFKPWSDEVLAIAAPHRQIGTDPIG